MSTTRPAHPFRVVQGGGAASPDVRLSTGDRQQQLLRQAVLRLAVPEVGLTVEEALQEISDKLDSDKDDDVAQLAILRDRAEVELGLRFNAARPDTNVARKGYFILAWPERLVRRHPELADLYPEAHPSMMVG